MKPVSRVTRIKDPVKRMTDAADLAREAEEAAQTYRDERDLAIMVMLRPFADAVADTNAERNRLRERLAAGDLSDDAYRKALEANRAQRQKDLTAADPEYYPADIYKMLGVSRNLVNRILMRMPVEALPHVEDPAKVAVAAHKKIGPLEETLAKAREIRDTAALMIMDGEATDSKGRRLMCTNADIARATNLTTARVAQLRKGVR